MNILQIAMQNSDIIMSAVGAMMRGESPSNFLKKLATTHPKFQGYNYDDMEGTANALCEQNNVNKEELTVQIKDFAKSYINK